MGNVKGVTRMLPSDIDSVGLSVIETVVCLGYYAGFERVSKLVQILAIKKVAQKVGYEERLLVVLLDVIPQDVWKDCKKAVESDD